MSATMQLLNSNGVPIVKSSGCAINIGGFSLKLHGGASWLYNLLLKLFRKQIEDAVQKAIDSTACSTIENSLNKALASLPLKEPVRTKELVIVESHTLVRCNR